MARQTQVKNYNNFVKGLITEAEALTFPENASLDELNCVPSVKGSRRRRLGIDYETGYALSNITFALTELDTTVVTTHTWEAVGGNGSLNFLVIQINNDLYFHDLGEDSISDGEKSFTVNLTSFLAPGLSAVGTEPIQVTSGKGVLFVASSKINPFYIEYNSGTDNITTTAITVQIRDFTGVDDSLAISNNPSSLSNLHEYNLKNQGWVNPPGISTSVITQYKTSTSFYPSNVQVWWIGRDVSENFDPTILSKQDFGNTPAPKGHYILEALYQDRSAVSGVASITVQSSTNRPQTIAFFSGRVFYAGIQGSTSGTNIYFSQVIFDSLDNVGYCYQVADPTSENDSILADSDGGIVSIPEIGNIKKLFTLDRFLVVLADNGIWAITGSDSGFKATSYEVLTVSKVNCLAGENVVSVEGIPVWWSSQGIFTIEINNVTKNLSAKSLTQDTIQSFYDDDITALGKLNAMGRYDRATKSIVWLYKEDDVGTNLRKFDRALVLDVRLNAFYPWKFEDLTNNSPFIASVFNTTSLNIISTEESVVDGLNVVMDGANVVTDTVITTGASNTFLSFLTIVPNTTTSKYTFSELNNRNFMDWQTKDSVGITFDSYVITGYELAGDLMRDKQIVYLNSYFKKTETAWQLSDNGDYELVNPSSCFLQARWDWSDSDASNKWSDPQQVYRFKLPIYPDQDDLTFDNGFVVTMSKSKVRGYGKSLSLKFYSETGKDFDLLGWSIMLTGETRP